MDRQDEKPRAGRGRPKTHASDKERWRLHNARRKAASEALNDRLREVEGELSAAKQEVAFLTAKLSRLTDALAEAIAIMPAEHCEKLARYMSETHANLRMGSPEAEARTADLEPRRD